MGVRAWNDPHALHHIQGGLKSWGIERQDNYSNTAAYWIKQCVINLDSCFHCHSFAPMHSKASGCLYSDDTYDSRALYILRNAYLRNDITGAHIRAWEEAKYAPHLFEGSDLLT